jgi:hypothetical protein
VLGVGVYRARDVWVSRRFSLGAAAFTVVGVAVLMLAT